MAEVKGPGSLWSEAEDAVVREAYRAERVDIGAAAARVGRTPGAVASRAKRLGVQRAGRAKPRPRGERCPRTPTEIQQAAWWAGVLERVYASILHQGATVEDVADRLKLLRAIVRGALYELEAEGKVRRQERVGGTRTWHVAAKESALWQMNIGPGGRRPIESRGDEALEPIGASKMAISGWKSRASQTAAAGSKSDAATRAAS